MTRRWWPGRQRAWSQRAGSQWRLLGVCVALAVGCIDTSSPNGPVLSISAVRIASPSIAVGDVMRDSAGNPAPVSVTAFDGAGHPVTTLTPTFVVPTRGMHLGTDLVLVGDSIGTSSVVGEVGGVQSAPATVIITFDPDSASGSTPDTLHVVINGTDTLKSSALTVTVTGGNPRGTTAGAGRGGAAGYVVYYKILHAPASTKSDSATALLMDGTRASSVDTTDASGIASREAGLMLHLVADAGLLNGTASDSIVVQATVNGRGAAIHPSPVVRFVIPVSK